MYLRPKNSRLFRVRKKMSGSTKFIQISVQAEFEGESLLFSLRGIDFSERSFLKLAKAHVGDFLKWEIC